MATTVPADTSHVRISLIPPGLEIDAKVLPAVSEYLARGLDLKRWWDQVEASGGPAHKFPLVRVFNRPTRSYGFFDEASVAGQSMPVMGNVQEMFYDQTRGPAGAEGASIDWMRAQLEEFVLKYFMRISSFRPPDTYVDASQPIPPPALEPLSWCARPGQDRMGFGFSQLFSKRAGSSSIDPFPSYDQHAIADQRQLGRLFEWMLLRVRIFDFALTAKPFGERGPQLVFGLNEESYLVVHEQFVRRGERSAQTGAFRPLADYGIGYAFVKNPTQTIFAYGPGEFDAAFETINFRIYDTGYISVRMVFVANRPSHTLRLSLDPVEWSFRFADAFSLGLASRFFAPVKDVLERLPLRLDFDPVEAYITGANVLSDGSAARTLCISLETIEKLALIQHFRQHYQTILGSLETWRLVKDWKNTEYLRENFPWIISGLSS